MEIYMHFKIMFPGIIFTSGLVSFTSRHRSGSPLCDANCGAKVHSSFELLPGPGHEKSIHKMHPSCFWAGGSLFSAYAFPHVCTHTWVGENM